MRKWGKESVGVCEPYQVVHSALRDPAYSLSSSSVMVAVVAARRCGRGHRLLHHQRHRHFLWSKAVRTNSERRRFLVSSREWRTIF